MEIATQGRTAQRSRTRKAILRAASRLLERGERPSLDDIAAEAEVSRATAYRYFPGMEALLGEAAVDALVPEPDTLFADGASQDIKERLALVDDTFDRACRSREVALRMMLARILERSALGETSEPLRQNRRVPMIEEALSPLRARLDPQRHELLSRALAMIVGAESFIVLTDVVGLDEAEAREVRRWSIDTLLDAALTQG
ncbi:MAG TPA: helix-turn-helix domain-containing protein [Novosphingobium sp.]|nr:helix-turn-helix domain-containing protein [Novosphingobium sp.]